MFCVIGDKFDLGKIENSKRMMSSRETKKLKQAESNKDLFFEIGHADYSNKKFRHVGV
jgi:hypothetical protein